MAHKCNCPTPPGGDVTCEPHQLAICRVIPGPPPKSRARCVTPPKNANPQELQNWALGKITRIRRSRNQVVTRREVAILGAGRYEDPRQRFVVTFNLPRNMNTGTATA